jgi:dihydroneopterin aldolase
MEVKEYSKTLENLKKENPFKTPERYFDNLTESIMSNIPTEENLSPKTIKVSLFDRVKPWLYMAAIFAGLGLFFKAIKGNYNQEQTSTPDLLVKTEIAASQIDTYQNDDEDFLEYIEDKYSSYLLDSEVYGTDIDN